MKPYLTQTLRLALKNQLTLFKFVVSYLSKSNNMNQLALRIVNYI